MNEIEEYGYADIPPEGTTEIPNPPKENKSYFDRPIYTIPEDARKERDESIGKMNYAVLVMTGILVLALAGAYLYWSGEKASVTVTQPAATEARVENTGNREAVKLELLRTIDLLGQMEQKLSGEPEKLEKIKILKEEAVALAESVSGEGL